MGDVAARELGYFFMPTTSPATPIRKTRISMLPRISALTALTLAAVLAVTATPALAADAGGCPDAALSQPFAPWADPAQYSLVPGGDFEAVPAGWSLDGAVTAGGNESFLVHDAADSRSLLLGDSGTATTPDVCLAPEDPTLRLFVRNTGSPLSALLVSATYDGAAGVPVTVPLATVAAGPDWRPSQQVAVVFNLLSLPVVSDGSTDVRFTFTPVGPGGSWSIDDVYLDPFKTK
jgi:hypothetical protein